MQRTIVREAVLRSKDPKDILKEIEEIEKMGKYICYIETRTSDVCSVEIESGGSEELPNEKGLKEKKYKLHETLQRLIHYFVR